MSVCLDGGERSQRHPRVALAGKVDQREPRRLSDAERLGDGQRPVPEMRLGREQLKVDALLSELSERKRRLQRGHSTARDQDPVSGLLSLTLAHRSSFRCRWSSMRCRRSGSIRAAPESSCGKAATCVQVSLQS